MHLDGERQTGKGAFQIALNLWIAVIPSRGNCDGRRVVFRVQHQADWLPLLFCSDALRFISVSSAQERSDPEGYSGPKPMPPIAFSPVISSLTMNMAKCW